MRVKLGSVVVVLAMLLTREAQAAKLIAVLPLDVSHTKGKMDADARTDLEEMLRDIATDALTSQGWTVLTGETTLQILQDNGVDSATCGDQSCHLSMAREIKAEKFLSGSVRYVEGSFTASIRLIDTATGRILASASLEGDTVKALRKDFRAKAADFFSKAGMLGGAGAPPTTEPEIPNVAPGGPSVKKGQAVGTLTITAKPTNLVRLDLVDPDGKKSSSGGSYENRQAKPGTWKVTATATGYEAQTQEVEVPADDVTVVKIELRAPGSLKITGTPAGAAVTVSGPDGFHDVGGLPWVAEGLKGGTYQVKVAQDGYGTDWETVELKAGEGATLRVKLEKGGMVRIAGADFQMGSNTGEPDEKPITRVTLSPYLIDQTDVTVAAYAACVKAGKCRADHVSTVHFDGISDGEEQKWSQACNWGKAGFENHPMNCVDWEDAKTFCEWKGGRLPTEAEWEYAARGGDGRRYPWGNDPPTPKLANACGKECREWWKRALGDDHQVMYEENDGWPTTSPVGSFPAGASPFGLQDMAGNVWQWVADASWTYPGGSVTDPRNEAGSMRTYRGGGWNDNLPGSLSGTRRSLFEPTVRFDMIGFRCARSAAR